MTRTRIIDQSNDMGIASSVMEALDECGYGAEEAIAGLIQAVVLLAEKTSNPELALDEAANLLADSGVN